MSASSSSSSRSGESSSSDSDSEYGGNSLTASQWNRQRALRSILPRSPEDAESISISVSVNHHLNHLVTKRRYPAASIPSRDGHEVEKNAAASTIQKSEIENAVLMDCLSTHFLWSHLPTVELEALCNAFQKCSYRNHKIIYNQGDEAQFMYILYSGDVVRRRDLVTLDSDDDSSDSEKYTVLGEFALLTGSTYTETVQATTSNNSCCTLFCLDRESFHRSLRPIPKIYQDECSSLLRKAIPDEMVHYFTDDDLKQLSSAMTTHSLEKGEVLARKEDRLDSLVIIAKGSVIAKEVGLGGRSYEDQQFGPDAALSFGWQSLLSSSTRKLPSPNNYFKGKTVAQSVGVALTLSKTSFNKVMKSHLYESSTILEQIAARRLARIELQQIPVFQDSRLD